MSGGGGRPPSTSSGRAPEREPTAGSARTDRRRRGGHPGAIKIPHVTGSAARSLCLDVQCFDSVLGRSVVPQSKELGPTVAFESDKGAPGVHRGGSERVDDQLQLVQIPFSSGLQATTQVDEQTDQRVQLIDGRRARTHR